MRTLFYLILILLIWGSSSIIVVNFKSNASPIHIASFVVVIATIFYYIYFKFRKIDQVKKLTAISSQGLLRVFFLSLLGPFLYPIFYFKGLHSSQPIEANVINYFWPIVAVISGFILNTEKITTNKVFAILIGFLGVLMTTVSIKIFSNYTSPVFSMQNYSAYLAAAGGALCYGIYSAFLKKFKILNKDSTDVADETVFFGTLISSSVLHVCVILVLLLSGYKLSVFSITPRAIVFVIVYSIFNFGLAYILWIKLLKLATVSQVTTTAFLIPVISTILLYFFFGTSIDFNVILGLSAILIALYLIHDTNSYASPISTLFIGLVIFGLIVLLSQNSGDFNIADIIGLLQIFVGVFAIYSGFILTRVISQYNEENLLIFSIEDALMNLACINKVDKNLNDKVDDVMNELIEIHAMPGKISSVDYEPVNAKKEQLGQYINKLQDRHDKSDELALQYYLKFDSAFIKWKYLRTETLSLYEWLILIIVSLTMVILIFFIKSPNIYYDVAKIAFGCAILQCLVAIRDFDSRRPEKKLYLIQITQRLSQHIHRQSYIPYNLLEKYNAIKTPHAGKMEGDAIQVRTRINGKITEVLFRKKRPKTILLVLFIFFTCVLEFLFLILRHSLL